MRYLKSLTNKELARRLSVHPSTLSRWKGKPPEWAAQHIATLKQVEGVLWPRSNPDNPASILPTSPSDAGSSGTTESAPASAESLPSLDR